MAREPGISFGSYTLLRRIAQGGMAEVFIARQEGMEGFDRVVAIKRILPHLLDDISFVRMFQNEARLAARLSHPSIIHIYDFGKVDEHFFIAMEFIDGVHTGELIARSSQYPMPPALVARIGADAAAGLHYAHQRKDDNGQPLKLVHRDVSPPNLLVSYEGNLKLLDFGIAKAVNTIEQTRSGVVKGKFAYMSPEQTMGQTLDGRSDVFSLALVLWELLAGRGAVTRDDQILAMQTIRDGNVPPVETVRSDVPKGLAFALRRALSKSPDRRPNAQEFASDLEKYLKKSSDPSSAADLGAWLQREIPRTPVLPDARDSFPSTQPAQLATSLHGAGTIPGLGEQERIVFSEPGAKPTYQDFSARPQDTSGILPLHRASTSLFAGSERLGGDSVVVRLDDEPDTESDTDYEPRTEDDNFVTRVMPHPMATGRREDADLIASPGSRLSEIASEQLDTVVISAPLPMEIDLPSVSHEIPKPADLDPANPNIPEPKILQRPSSAYQVELGPMHHARRGNTRFVIIAIVLLLVLVGIGAFAYQKGLLDPFIGSSSKPTQSGVEQPSTQEIEPASPPTPIVTPLQSPSLVDASPNADTEIGLGQLTIRSTPRAQVYRGKTKLGMTPLLDFPLPEGSYLLRLKAKRRRTVTREVEIRKGETSTLRVRLPRR